MDPSWEFQAPQFVDFTNLDDDKSADTFFDVDMESGSRVSQIFSGKISDEFKSAPAPMPTVTESAEPAEQPSQQEPEKQKMRPKNMVTSWEGLKIKAGKPGDKPAKSNANEAPRRVERGRSGDLSSSSQQANRQNTPSRRSLRQTVVDTVENIRRSPALKPKRLGTNVEAPRIPVSQISKSLQSSTARARSKSPGHALPRTPDVMRRLKSKMAAGLAQAKESADFKVKKSIIGKKLNQPMKANAQPALKAPVLTRPAEFKFATSARVKESRRRSMSVPDAPDFSRMLRSYTKPTVASNVIKETTKPVPFPRTEMNRKRRHSEENSAKDKYRSMAEQITKFQAGTPDRFRSQPRGRSASPNKNRIRLRSQSPKLTVPKTPMLTTKGRSRPTYVMSQKEKEELELEEMKMKQFHAKAVGETLPRYNYGEVEKRPCTIPQPFNLAIASKPFSKPQPPEEHVEPFHSRPLNKKILQGPTGIPERKLLPVVEPESPAFALKQRLGSRRAPVEPVLEPERIIKAKPVPHWGVPVALPQANKRSTVPEPFSFEERDTMSAARKEERIKKLLEEEKHAREFHAQPIAKGLDNPKLPERKVLPPTKSEPFHLAIDERVESRINKWQEEVQKELETQRAACNFKATEAKVLSKAPFVPKPSEKPLAEISNFTLHTDRRAEERGQYEMEKKKKEVDLEEAKRNREERKKREEEEEIARLRKQAVHKAQPIRGYKPVEIRPSDRPLTLPVSPRLSVRSKNNSTFNRTSQSQD